LETQGIDLIISELRDMDEQRKELKEEEVEKEENVEWKQEINEDLEGIQEEVKIGKIELEKNLKNLSGIAARDQ
jgi:hypothetical protein